jgi:hypothetical protein
MTLQTEQWQKFVNAYNGDEQLARDAWRQTMKAPIPTTRQNAQQAPSSVDTGSKPQNEFTTEQELTQAIIKALRAQGCIAFHSDAGHTTDATSSKRGRPPKGFPDIPVYAPNGKHVLLEVKQPTGKLSEDQANFIKSIRKLEHHVKIVRSVQEALDAVFGNLEVEL